jgi:hypothetical protein
MTGWLLFAALLPAMGLGADWPPQDDPWQPVRFLEGSWTGTAEGRFGSSTITRTYSFVLEGAYLHERHRSVYPPQELNPEGEIHNTWSFFSFDRDRGLLVLRQFHDERIVNRFVLDTALSHGNRVVFDTEAIENFREGWRAREMYTVISQDEFVEEFFLGAPGEDLVLFVTSRFKRTAEAPPPTPP